MCIKCQKALSVAIYIWLCLVTYGGVTSIDSSDYKAPTNILIHAPAKISLDYSTF